MVRRPREKAPSGPTAGVPIETTGHGTRDTGAMQEETFLKRVEAYASRYDRAVASPIADYSGRIIAAYLVSPQMGLRSAEAGADTVRSEAMGGVTKALSGAYMLGKQQANQTLPRNIEKRPVVGFNAADMDNLDELRDFSEDEIAKYADGLRVLVKLRSLSEPDKQGAIDKIREDFDKRRSGIMLIANTETWRAAIEGRVAEYEDRRVEYLEWVDFAGCCEDCDELDQQVWPIDEAPHPPIHSNCRCCLVSRYFEVGREAPPWEE